MPQTLAELTAEAVAVYGLPPEPTTEQIAALLADTRVMERLRKQKPNTPDHILAHKHMKRKHGKAQPRIAAKPIPAPIPAEPVTVDYHAWAQSKAHSIPATT
jgi:hypothetical protein